jgi:hypothetical protein
MSFNIYLGLYIVAAIMVISGGSTYFFKSSRLPAAIIFIIGSISVFIYYGIRWFGTSSSLFSQSPVSWPPTINTCPDFLIYYKREKTPGVFEDTCIDKIGVSKNGLLKKIPENDEINNGNDEYFFSLSTKSNDDTTRKMELCNKCLQYGLTWEGICNGESCYSPDNGGTIAPPTNGSNCPPSS